MKNNLVLFLMTLLVSVMMSCSSDNDKGIDEAQQLEELRAQLVQDMQNSPNNPNNNPTASTRVDDSGGGTSICYNANVSYDYDCDGVSNVGVNKLAATWSCCWDNVSDMYWTAIRNGWCYYTDSKNQCKQFSCDPVPPCSNDLIDDPF